MLSFLLPLLASKLCLRSNVLSQPSLPHFLRAYPSLKNVCCVTKPLILERASSSLILRPPSDVSKGYIITGPRII